jgi:hypothetical protein
MPNADRRRDLEQYLLDEVDGPNVAGVIGVMEEEGDYLPSNPLEVERRAGWMNSR